jgi:hypothetical protein
MHKNLGEKREKKKTKEEKKNWLPKLPYSSIAITRHFERKASPRQFQCIEG